jgi:microcystin-dependent protein
MTWILSPYEVQDVTGEVPVGGIIPYGSASLPAGFALCDGSAVSRTTYSLLFSLYGTAYGAGDGSTTFNLPNLEGKFPGGADGVNLGPLGTTGGSTTITVGNLPAHAHPGSTGDPSGHTHAAASPASGFVLYFSPSTDYPATSSTPGYDSAHPFTVGNTPPNSATATGSGTISVTVASQGGGSAYTPPFQTFNWIIRVI